jgi:hypothetical protein
MQAVLSSMLALPHVLLGCLTLPVPGSSLEYETALVKPLRTLANPTPATGRRRELLVRSVERGIDRARKLSQAERFDEAVQVYRTLLTATEGDERFAASRDRIESALAALELRLVKPALDSAMET